MLTGEAYTFSTIPKANPAGNITGCSGFSFRAVKKFTTADETDFMQAKFFNVAGAACSRGKSGPYL